MSWKFCAFTSLLDHIRSAKQDELQHNHKLSLESEGIYRDVKYNKVDYISGRSGYERKLFREVDCLIHDSDKKIQVVT